MARPTITFGSATSGITLAVWRRVHAPAENYWDGNWLSTEIRIAVGSFKGQIDADLRAEEFERFKNQLQNLHDGSVGHAEFETVEGWITLHLVVTDGLGHIRCDGTVTDQPGIGNRLTFSLDLDQSYLPQLIADLDELTTNFPVVGAP
jgi:hypothetical protein